MSDDTPSPAPPVADEEWLARFIFRKRDLYPNGRVKPDPFVPFPHRDLSVTRRLGSTENEIWCAGVEVARARKIQLVGRADLQASVPRSIGLDVVPDPPPPNHANIVGWVVEKELQKKQAATDLCDRATFFEVPSVP